MIARELEAMVGDRKVGLMTEAEDHSLFQERIRFSALKDERYLGPCPARPVTQY